MKIDLTEGVVGLTDFARNTRQHAEELIESGKPRLLTQNGRAALVVMSVDSYQSMASDAEEHQMDQRLQEALQSYSEGDRGRPANEVFAEIRSQRASRCVGMSDFWRKLETPSMSRSGGTKLN